MATRKPNLNNGDLSFNFINILGYDEINIKKDVINNEGEPSYILDVNDTGYFYADETERDQDYEALKGVILHKYRNPSL